MCKNPNHPKKGSSTRVSPIRSQKSIEDIKTLLKQRPRDLAIFILGINTCLRASDILSLKVGQIRNVGPGETFYTREKKTGKEKRITMNHSVYSAINSLLTTMSCPGDTDYLFQSRKGENMPLSVSALNTLVKKWCDWVGLKGNYGTHTLRKTFSFCHYHIFKTPVILIMDMLNHNNLKMTYIYLGIQPEDIKEAYMKDI